MGQQIQTAFDDEDERRIISWLASDCRLLCVSYPMGGPEFLPRSLEDRSGRRMLVFPPQAIPLLSAHVISTGFANEYVIKSAVARGLTFEWNRTNEARRGVFVAGGGDANRFYFVKDEGAPLNEELSRIVRRLFAYVKRTSPLKSTGRIPRFVGENLATKLREKTAELLYPNGSRIELVANDAYSCGAPGRRRS